MAPNHRATRARSRRRFRSRCRSPTRRRAPASEFPLRARKAVRPRLALADSSPYRPARAQGSFRRGFPQVVHDLWKRVCFCRGAASWLASGAGGRGSVRRRSRSGCEQFEQGRSLPFAESRDLWGAKTRSRQICRRIHLGWRRCDDGTRKQASDARARARAKMRAPRKHPPTTAIDGCSCRPRACPCRACERGD